MTDWRMSHISHAGRPACFPLSVLVGFSNAFGPPETSPLFTGARRISAESKAPADASADSRHTTALRPLSSTAWDAGLFGPSRARAQFGLDTLVAWAAYRPSDAHGSTTNPAHLPCWCPQELFRRCGPIDARQHDGTALFQFRLDGELATC